MFDRPRSAWLPAGEPFTGPVFEPASIEQVVVHYIGTARAPTNSAAWMLNEHRRTMNLSSPYAFMYNAHVALDGTTWEGRGVQFRNAANGSATNRSTWSIVFAVNGQEEASDAQVAGARELISSFRSWLGRSVPLVPHRSIGSTQCPGEGITAQIASGVFERSGKVSRIAGSNRYHTAAMVSQAAYPSGSNIVYVASGEDFPDALAAATFKDGPLLLTRTNQLPPETAEEVRRLGAKRIIIVGGVAAVSESVANQLDRLVL